jgi:hypothetical protein
MVNAVSITIILGRGGTGNKTSWILGNTLQFPSPIRRIGFVVLNFGLKLTAIRIVGINDALEGALEELRSRLVQGLLLRRFRFDFRFVGLFRHGLLRLVPFFHRNRLHMGKRRGNNGWTHLTLYRVVVITLQSALDFVAILVRTEVRKEQQGFPLVYSSEAL